MSQAVIAQAKALAQQIRLSPEYIKMRAAEDALSQDENLLALAAAYEDKRQDVEKLTLEDEPDYEQMMALTHELEALRDQYSAYPLAKAAQQARKDFAAMMREVNAELKNVLNPGGDEGSCSGSCAGCSGCG